MIKLLHEDRFFRVEHNPRDGLIRIARSGVSFGGAAEREVSHRAVEASLTSVPNGSKLLLDERETPAADPGLDALFARFARVAIVTKAPRPGLPAGVLAFTDEDRAFDHLLG